MPSSHDTAFGGAAVKQRVLTSEQLILGAKVQAVLEGLGISKPLAVVAVEAGWIELDQALLIVTGLRKLGVDHPEVKPREASDADEAVLEKLSPAARKKLEAASRSLAALFYARGAGTLALDQGSPGAAAARGPRKPADPTPTPAPARRLKPPVVAPVVVPPRKSSAMGAILAATAALAAIIGLLVFKKGKPPPPEPEPPPVVRRQPPPPPVTPVPPPKPPPTPPPGDSTDPKPEDPETDAAVEEQRKKYIEEEERKAEGLFEEIKKLLAEGRPASARGKLRQLTLNYNWTQFVKLRAAEIARLTKDADAEMGSAMPEDTGEPSTEPVPEGAPLPAMAAALKRLDEGASADARRAAGARTRLAGWKSDLVLRGGKVVKQAEVVDVSREDLRVRGEIDGAKIDLLLAWAALDAPTFLAVQRQMWKSLGAAGHFELGRAAVQRRLWKDAKAAFDECVKADAAWKPRLPDIGALLADPAILRGGARRMGDGRLVVEYLFADAEQAGDFSPVGKAPGALAVTGGALKFACKAPALWSLKDLAFEGDVDVVFEFEGPGEIAVGFAPPENDAGTIFHFSSGKLRVEGPKPSGDPQPATTGTPVRVERRGNLVRVRQGDRDLCTVLDSGGPRRLVIGANSEGSLKNLLVSGEAPGEMTRRLGPLERLEGGAQAGDFRLDPAAVDAEAVSRAMQAEAALEAGNLDDAWSLADEAVSKTPADGLAMAVRGLVRLAQGEMRLAVADADLALALDPCRGEVALRARRILAQLRGASATGAHRRRDVGPWAVRSDVSEERLAAMAARLEESGKRFGEAMKDAGPAPKSVPVTIFASREAWLIHAEATNGRQASIVDAPGADSELLRLAARSYIRAASSIAPPWFVEGMAAHLSGETRVAEMKSLLPQAAPLEALLKKGQADFTESDRIQSASLVRFLQAGEYKSIVPDLLKKLSHGVPAIESFSGKSLPKIDGEWRTWAEKSQ